MDEANPASMMFSMPQSGRPRSRLPRVAKARPTAQPQKDQPLKFLPCKSNLSRVARSLWQMVECSTDGVLDLNEAACLLNIPKRRMYDFTSVLQGAGVLAKRSMHTFQWVNNEFKMKLDHEVQMLVDQENKLDELIKTSLEQVYHMCEDEISERFLYLSYEDIKTMPSLREETVIVVNAPAETVLEVLHPAESLQLYLKSTQGPIDVYLCSEDHSPFDVPDEDDDDDGSGDDDHTDCSTDDGDMEPQSFLSASPRDAADDSRGDAVTTEHSSALSTCPVSPSPTPLGSLPPPSRSSSSPSSPSSEGEEKQSFATLTTPLALALGGEEYLLSLGEDEGISDLFSSGELEGGMWKCLAQANPPPP